MSHMSAFLGRGECGGHVTLLFTVSDEVEDPIEQGSLGAGLCVEDGVEVVAFGDNLNDLTMLEWAGRGIAMANAPDEVKDVADEITSTNTEFGVARVLEELG